jgi:hypothetical protein
MSNIIAIPLNKLTRSARNVRKSGGDSIDPVYAVFKLELAAGEALPDGRPNAPRRNLPSSCLECWKSIRAMAYRHWRGAAE